MSIRLSFGATLIIITLLILGAGVSYVPATIYPQKTKTAVLDTYQRGDLTDMTRIEAWDNSTHFLVKGVYGDAWDGPTGDLLVQRYFKFNFYIIIDPTPERPYPLIVSSRLSFIASSDGSFRLIDNPADWGLPGMNLSWFIINDDSLGVSLPLDYLASIIPPYFLEVSGRYAAAAGYTVSRIYLYRPEAWTTVYDYIGEPGINYYNISLLKANITVDGSDDDWMGLQPVLTDTVAPNKLSSQGVDIRNVYVAMDDTSTIMYILVNSTGPLSWWSQEYSRNFSIKIFLDVNGDGIYDRIIILGKYGATIAFRYGWSIRYVYLPLSSNAFNMSVSQETGVLEYSILLSYLQLPSSVVGFISGESHARYYFPSLLRKGYYSSITHEIGVGGYAAKVTEYVEQQISSASNPNIIHIGDADIKINVRWRYTYLMLYLYDNNPLPWGSVDCIPKFYFFYTSVGYLSASPIQMDISYTDAALDKHGIIEDFLTPYYFNYTTMSFEPLPDYVVYKDRNIVSISIDPTVFPGSLVIVLGQPPDARSKLGKTFQGMSSVGPAKLFLNTYSGKGYIEVSIAPLMAKEKYNIEFSVVKDTNLVMVLRGTITMTVGGIELKLPITIYIDKVNNKATVVGALSFITF